MACSTVCEIESATFFVPSLAANSPALPWNDHGRTASGHAGDFAIAPAHAVIPAGAESLHGGFFGGEARGIALEAIRLGIAIANLSRSVDALQKAVPEALDGLADAGDFGDVDARAYDHSGYLAGKSVGTLG